MKTLLTGVAVLGLLGFSASNLSAQTDTNIQVLTVRLTSMKLLPPVTHGNITINNATTERIDTKAFLTVIAASLTNTFPAGAKLGYNSDLEDFVVLDSSGVVITNVSQGLRDQGGDFFIDDYEGITTARTDNGVRGGDAETEYQPVIVRYDDGKTTIDGQIHQIIFSGLMVTKSTEKTATGAFTRSFTITGSGASYDQDLGSGSAADQSESDVISLLKGSISGASKGTAP